MGKQINFYVKQPDIEKAEKYLKDRGFVFIQDVILPQPELIFLDKLFTSEKKARYISFPGTRFNYLNWESEGKTYYRLSGIESATITFSCFGEQHGLYRFRFHYDPYNFVNGEPVKKDPDFEAAVDRFFRWCRRNFERVPDWPTFFQNPAHPVKVFF